MIDGFTAFARFEFEMSKNVEGQPVREHLEAYKRQTGRVHPTLMNAPALPSGCEPLWNDFLALSFSRQSGGYGPSAIALTDIEAFQRLEGIQFRSWELRAIRAADREYLAFHAEQAKDKAKRQ